jgi:hypothetical protein
MNFTFKDTPRLAAGRFICKIFFAKRGKWHPFKTVESYIGKGSPPDFVAILESTGKSVFCKL